MNDARSRWYHVCEFCTAKFYSSKSVEKCRCGTLSESHERDIPPWMRYEQQKESKSEEEASLN